MKLLQREIVGQGVHRSGWPQVMRTLQTLATGEGALLDDFTDASFSYRSVDAPHREPWVGVFHHAVQVASPLPEEADCELRRIERHRHWPASRKNLCGAIALCDEVAADLRDWLRVPVLSLWHPREADPPRWRLEAALAQRRLVQVGYYLRNTRLIFQVAPPGWRRFRLFGADAWRWARDAALRASNVRPEIAPAEVKTLPHLSHAIYDQLLAESVLVTELYGAAANNLIVECLVRGAPLAVNRWPAVEEYLGADYPLFYRDVAELPDLLEPSRLAAAHIQLLERARRLPRLEEFARRALEFVEQCHV